MRSLTLVLLFVAAAAALLAGCSSGSDQPHSLGPDLFGGAEPVGLQNPAPQHDAPEMARVPATPDTLPPAAPSAAAERPFVLQPAAWAERPACCWFPAPALSASAAVVLDEASGAVLFDQDAHRQLAPASLTKVVTAMVVLESGISLDHEILNNVDSRLMYGSSVMGLHPGDIFTIRDLLYGLMLPSGNDAALALGRVVSGSDAAFVAEMNKFVDRLGLKDTHFANAHGLSSRDHYSSAYDLAVISRYAMTNPTFAEIVRTPWYEARGSRTIGLANVNPFLNYPGGDGLKTGYTNRAGKTLIASATRNGHRVYLVLLNAPNREGDAWALMDWAFNNSAWK